MRLSLAFPLLAACSSPGMLEVIVSPPEDGTRVDVVELYVGVHGAHEGDSVLPAEGTLAPTVWWKRDLLPVEFSVQPMSPRAVFQFERGGIEDAVASVVAVGYDSSLGRSQPAAVAAQLLWLDIPGDNEVHDYRLTLGPYDRLPGTDRTGVPGLQIWGPPGAPDLCVQVDDVPELAEYAGATTGTIVKRNDHDCDGFEDDDTSLECLPDEYFSALPMTRDELTCVMTDRDGHCVAGGHGCADGIVRGECAPSNYCTFNTYCDAGCTDLASCDQVDPTTLPMTVCTLFYNPSLGEFCQDAQAKAIVDLFKVVSNVPNLACDPVKGAKISDGTQGFGTQVRYTSGTGTLTFDLTAADAAHCKFIIEASGNLQSGAGGSQLIYRFAMTSPLTAPVNGRGVVVPILIKAEPGDCNNASVVSSCTTFPLTTTQATDIAACVTAPPLRGTVVSD